MLHQSYLTGAREAILEQHEVKESRVEHYITMVGDKEMALLLHHILWESKGCSLRTTPDTKSDDRFHKPYLEVLGCLYTPEHHTQDAITQSLWQPRGKSLHNQVKLSVFKKFIKDGRHFVLIIGAYFIKIWIICHI